MAMRHRPDDVLRPERRVAAEEDARDAWTAGSPRSAAAGPSGRTPGRCRARSRGRSSPGRSRPARRRTRWNSSGSPDGISWRRPLASYSALTFSNSTPSSLPSSCCTSFGTSKLRMGMSSRIASSFSQGDAFISSKPERTITFTSLAAEPAGGAAAIHRGVAAAEHDDALADLGDVAERDGGQPVDADMDVGCGFLAARHVEVAAARRAGADEHRVVALGQQRLQAVDRWPKAGLARRGR